MKQEVTSQAGVRGFALYYCNYAVTTTVLL